MDNINQYINKHYQKDTYAVTGNILVEETQTYGINSTNLTELRIMIENIATFGSTTVNSYIWLVCNVSVSSNVRYSGYLTTELIRQHNNLSDEKENNELAGLVDLGQHDIQASKKRVHHLRKRKFPTLKNSIYKKKLALKSKTKTKKSIGRIVKLGLPRLGCNVPVRNNVRYLGYLTIELNRQQNNLSDEQEIDDNPMEIDDTPMEIL